MTDEQWELANEFVNKCAVGAGIIMLAAVLLSFFGENVPW